MVTANDIATLWVKLTATFGYRFTETYGRRDPGVWRAVLKDLMPVDLDRGFRRMLTAHRYRAKGGHCTALTSRSGDSPVLAIWPPNALEFRQYCEQARQDCGLPSVHEAFVEAKSNSYLENPPWSHGVVKAAFDCLYQDNRKSAGDPVYDEDYSTFSHYYVALRDAYLAFPPSVNRPNRSATVKPSPPVTVGKVKVVTTSCERGTVKPRDTPSGEEGVTATVSLPGSDHRVSR